MLQDFRLAVRSLSHNPVFSFGAVATLALGIGVNSTIFTLANAALFKAMPGVASPSGLVWVSGVFRERPRAGGMSYPEYLDYRDGSRGIFSSLIAFAPTSFSLGSGGEPERIRGHLVTGSYFATLGALPAAGRVLQPGDDRPGAEPAAVLGYRLWRQRFGGTMDVLGQPILINGQQFTVVGVASDGFTGPELGQGADIWLPVAALPGINTTQAGWLNERGTLWLRVIGRLETGKTAQQAGSVLAGVAAALERTYPDTNKGRTVSVVGTAVKAEIRALDAALPVFDVRPLETVLRDRADKQRAVSALLAAFGTLALALAALGLYGVMAYAVTTRTREMGVRLALGATPAQLMRLIAGDGLRLALTGVVIGGLLALPLAQVLGALIFGVQIADLAAFAGTCALLVAVALVAAVLPARRTARLDPIVALRNE